MDHRVALIMFILSAWERSPYSELVSAAVDSDYYMTTDNVTVTVTFHTSPQSLFRAWVVCKNEYGGRLLSSDIHEYPSYIQQQFRHMMSQPEFLTHVPRDYFWVGLRDTLTEDVFYEDGRSSHVCGGTITLINGVDEKTAPCNELHMFACESSQVGNLCPYEKYSNALLVTEPGQMSTINEEECRFACDSSTDCWAYAHTVTEVPVCETYISVPQKDITLKHMDDCNVFIKTCAKGYIVANGSEIQIRSHTTHWLNSSAVSGLQDNKFPTQDPSIGHVAESTSNIVFITANYEYESIPPSSYLHIIPNYETSFYSDFVTPALVHESLFLSSFHAPSLEKESILPSTVNEDKLPCSQIDPTPNNKLGKLTTYITPTRSFQNNPSCNHNTSISADDNSVSATVDTTLPDIQSEFQHGVYSSVQVDVHQPSMTSVSLTSTPALESVGELLNSLSISSVLFLEATFNEGQFSGSSQILYSPLEIISTEALFPEKSMEGKATSTESPFLQSPQITYDQTRVKTNARSQKSSEPTEAFISQASLLRFESSLGLVSETTINVDSTPTYEDLGQSEISLTTVDHEFGMSLHGASVSFADDTHSSKLYHYTSPAYTLLSSTFNLCQCPCTQPEVTTSSMTKEEKSVMVNKIIQSLTVNKTQIGATRRKYVSVVDDRPFSRSAGCIGIAILVFVFLCILMLDMISVLQIVTPFRPIEQNE